MLIENLEVLAAYLLDAQSRRAERVECEFTASLSAQMSDEALVEALVIGLPMAQGIQRRIVRSRGRGAVLTAKIRYREGVRMLDGAALTGDEAVALEAALAIAAEALRLEDAEARFQWVYDLICRHVRYVHTAPGRKGYDRLVSAAGALLEGQANCQGFADALYLLCGLCGIEAEYRCGRGERRLHVWNAVRINGEWRETDVSKGARNPLSHPASG